MTPLLLIVLSITVILVGLGCVIWTANYYRSKLQKWGRKYIKN